MMALLHTEGFDPQTPRPSPPLQRLFDILAASDCGKTTKDATYMGWQLGINVNAPTRIKQLVEAMGPHIHDLSTHYSSWRAILVDDIAARHHDAEDVSHREHELKAFDRLFAALAGVSVPSPQSPTAPSGDDVPAAEVEDLFVYQHPVHHSITRLSRWPEGLVLWHEGTAVWKSWEGGADGEKLVEAFELARNAFAVASPARMGYDEKLQAYNDARAALVRAATRRGPIPTGMGCVDPTLPAEYKA